MISVEDVQIKKWFKDQWGNYYVKDTLDNLYLYIPPNIGIGDSGSDKKEKGALLKIIPKAIDLVGSIAGKIKNLLGGAKSKRATGDSFISARDQVYRELASLAAQYHGLSMTELENRLKDWNGSGSGFSPKVNEFFNDWVKCMRSIGAWEFSALSANFQDMFNKLETVAVPCMVNKWFAGANVSVPQPNTPNPYQNTTQQNYPQTQQQQNYPPPPQQKAGFMGMDNTTLLLVGGGLAAATLAAIVNSGDPGRKRR